MTEIDLEKWLSETTELGTVQRALVREQAIRAIVAETGEERRHVVDTMDALDSMDREAILDLTEGEPTTLVDALSRYVDVLEGRDEIVPRDGIVGDLSALLRHRWPGVPGAEELAREIHRAYVRQEPREVVPWEELSDEEHALAAATISDLIGRGVLSKVTV
jgi:hypothetical protein